ncbi:MAG: hypothetical protein R3275_03265 [Saprospiraceae bacterium]|nr:hypothetical protein [Saprospiraceae bacterium]
MKEGIWSGIFIAAGLMKLSACATLTNIERHDDRERYYIKPTLVRSLPDCMKDKEALSLEPPFTEIDRKVMNRDHNLYACNSLFRYRNMEYRVALAIDPNGDVFALQVLKPQDMNMNQCHCLIRSLSMLKFSADAQQCYETGTYTIKIMQE